MAQPQEIIRVERLWKVFGRDPRRVLSDKNSSFSKEELRRKTGCVIGLRNISLTIDKGKFYIIMGLSGSGKSTLVRTLLRLVNPTAGKIQVKGQEITKLAENDLLDFRKNTFGMVFQHYGLLPHLTVLDNAAFGLKVRKLPKERQHEMAMQALETVGLGGWEYYYPDNISGGMQQRVGLARALAAEPEILLMDEPFSGLDPLIRRQMQDEFMELQEKLQKTIVFVTHDLSEALKLGDQIAILHDGVIAQVGTPEEIVTNPANDYVREFVQDASPAKVISAGSIMESPELLLYSWEGLRTALTILKKASRQGTFVVDKEHKLLGVANQERLERFLSSGNNSESSKLGPPVIKDIPAVREDCILEDLFCMVYANPYPVPVVSETGRLLGVVKTDDIFEAISPNE